MADRVEARLQFRVSAKDAKLIDPDIEVSGDEHDFECEPKFTVLPRIGEIVEWIPNGNYDVSRREWVRVKGRVVDVTHWAITRDGARDYCLIYVKLYPVTVSGPGVV